MRNRWAALAATVFTGLLSDFVSKMLVLGSLRPGTLKPLIGDAVQLTLVFNQGAIFSLNPGNWIRGFPTAAFFIAVTVVELIAVVWFYARMDATRNRLSLWGLALVAAGAAGNLMDRLLGRPGVVDFIRLDLGFPPFDPWPIFNVADLCITLGVALVLLDSAPGRGASRSPQGEPPRGQPPAHIGGSQ